MKPVLIDTSAWVRYFRDKNCPEGDFIDSLIEDGIVCTTGVVIAELISGAASKREKEQLRMIFADVPFLQVTEPVWWKIGEYRNKMSRGGFTAGIPDTIIAAVAINYNAHLFTLDTHFDHIMGFLPLSLLRLG